MVVRSILGEKGISGDDASDLKWGLSILRRMKIGWRANSLLPKPSCHAEPILRRLCPLRFMVNQHMTTGMALKQPQVTRKRAP
jgi:hypothetical protein